MALITSGMIWYDIGHVWLVKQVLQLFPAFSCLIRMTLAVNKMDGHDLSNTFLRAHRQRCQSWCCASYKRRHINYLVVVTRRSALVIKVSGEMRSSEF